MVVAEWLGWDGMVWHCLSTPFQRLLHHPEYFVSGALVADPLGLLRHGGSIPRIAHLPCRLLPCRLSLPLQPLLPLLGSIPS